MDRLLLRESYEDADQPTLAGRTLTIRIATYGRVYRVAESGGRVLRERIAAGAFKEPMSRVRGVLRFRHIGEEDGQTDALENFHGVMTALREDDGALFGDFEVFEGAREDRLLRLIQSGGVTGASMSALIRSARKTHDAYGPLTEIQRVSAINGVSITPRPAYDDAGVVAIREMAPDREAVAARESRLGAVRAELAEARRYLDSLR